MCSLTFFHAVIFDMLSEVDTPSLMTHDVTDCLAFCIPINVASVSGLAGGMEEEGQRNEEGGREERRKREQRKMRQRRLRGKVKVTQRLIGLTICMLINDL